MNRHIPVSHVDTRQSAVGRRVAHRPALCRPWQRRLLAAAAASVGQRALAAAVGCSVPRRAVGPSLFLQFQCCRSCPDSSDFDATCTSLVNIVRPSHPAVLPA